MFVPSLPFARVCALVLNVKGVRQLMVKPLLPLPEHVEALMLETGMDWPHPTRLAPAACTVRVYVLLLWPPVVPAFKTAVWLPATGEVSGSVEEKLIVPGVAVKDCTLVRGLGDEDSSTGIRPLAPVTGECSGLGLEVCAAAPAQTRISARTAGILSGRNRKCNGRIVTSR